MYKEYLPMRRNWWMIVLLWLNASAVFAGYSTPYNLAFEDDMAPSVTTIDTLPPIEERNGDYINDGQNNPFDLNDPSAIDQTVEYDPETGLYIIREKVGDNYYRPATYMTFEEYLKWSLEKERKDYFKQLGKTSSGGGQDPSLQYIDEQKDLFDRLFGGTEISIRPQGNIDLTFGGDWQRVDNPILTERQRRQGGFDFDMNIQMNVSVRIRCMSVSS